jgi:hypothetical protein
MDITIHASFLPHDDPPAAGEALSNMSFIACGAVVERPLGARSQRGGGSNAEEMTTARAS